MKQLSLVPEDMGILLMCELQRLRAEQGDGRGKDGSRAGLLGLADWLASKGSPHLNHFHLS